MEEERRICLKCQRELPITCFAKCGLGYRKFCKECDEVGTISSPQNLSSTRRYIFDTYPDGYKRCSSCHRVLRKDKFPIAKDGVSLLRVCKKCREKMERRSAEIRAKKAEKENTVKEQAVKHVVEVSQKCMREKVARGCVNAGRKLTARRKNREAEEEILGKFRREEAKRLRKRRNLKVHSVQTPCRLCAFFLTRHCPDLTNYMLSAGMECTKFKNA